MENITKEFIKSNILTITEACEYLGVTRQMLNNYINQGKLEPLKQLSNGLIFYKADLIKFSENRYRERKSFNMKTEHIIFGMGNTRESMKCFEQEVTDCNEVISVRLYFEEKDAIRDGYFCSSESYEELNRPVPVRGPYCIIKLKNGEEKWFGGVNCGYIGTGPNGSVSILRKIGVHEEMAKMLYGATIIEFFLDDDEWDYQVIKSREDEIKEDIFSIGKISTKYYLYNNNLILAFCNGSDLFKVWDENPEEFIEINKAFIASPVSAEILSKEYALDSGHYVIDFGREILFQIILKDMSGKEIWLPCLVKENIPVARQDNIKEILKKFGIEISAKQCVKEELKYWLNIQPRIENKTVYCRN